MKAFANLSIRNKLIAIILVATLVPLAVGFYVVLRESRRGFEAEIRQSALLVAQVMGAYSALALSFDDRSISGLEIPDFDRVGLITDVIIYDRQDRVFDSYHRDGQPFRPEMVYHDERTELREGYVHVFVPIQGPDEDDPRTAGTFFLRATTAPFLARQQAFVRTLLWWLLGLMVVAVALAWGLQRVISQPILELAEAARRISEKADYSLRVQKPGEDEIGQLYDGFNAMLAQIEQRQSELERSNRDLDQFAYVASHDLKAPLRAIANLSSWLAEDNADLSPEAREQLGILRERVRRMDAMIDGILQYSRLGRSDSAGEQVDVAHLLHDLIEMLDKPPGMTIAVTTPMPVLTTRPLRLQQVFANLITNAIRYHDRPDGRVEISAAIAPDGTPVFSVADDGPGIAPEYHEKIFMMFKTVAGESHPESTGLGLSLVKKLVEDEGGTITVESAPGKGATFRFTWPEARSAS